MPDDGGIPTTLEMDGLFSEKDIQDRFKLMVQCNDCSKWTQQDKENNRSYKPCAYCSSTNFDIQSPKSLRTYNVFTDAKRKPKGNPTR